MFCDVAEGVAVGAHWPLLAGLLASSFYFIMRDATGLTFWQRGERGGDSCPARRIVFTVDHCRLKHFGVIEGAASYAGQTSVQVGPQSAAAFAAEISCVGSARLRGNAIAGWLSFI